MGLFIAPCLFIVPCLFIAPCLFVAASDKKLASEFPRPH